MPSNHVSNEPYHDWLAQKYKNRNTEPMFVTGALVLDGLDEAIVGASDCGRLIYDYQKMIQIFIGHGMTPEEAEEWISFNVMGVQCNGAGFIMMYDLSMIDIEGLPNE